MKPRGETVYRREIKPCFRREWREIILTLVKTNTYLSQRLFEFCCLYFSPQETYPAL